MCGFEPGMCQSEARRATSVSHPHVYCTTVKTLQVALLGRQNQGMSEIEGARDRGTSPLSEIEGSDLEGLDCSDNIFTTRKIWHCVPVKRFSQ